MYHTQDLVMYATLLWNRSHRVASGVKRTRDRILARDEVLSQPVSHATQPSDHCAPMRRWELSAEMIDSYRVVDWWLRGLPVSVWHCRLRVLLSVLLFLSFRLRPDN